MHRPERALGGGGLARLRGQLGVRVDLGQREVAEGEAQPAPEPVAHAPQDRLRRAAERALEVAVHDELQRRVGRAVDVVARAERRNERVGHGSAGS